MSPIINELLRRILIMVGQTSYRETKDRKVQKLIEDKIRRDPEAIPPTLGVPARHAFHDSNHERMMKYGQLKRLFEIKTSLVQVIRSYGKSPHAQELETMRKQMTEAFKRKFRIIGFQHEAWLDLQDELFYAILRRCIKARTKGLGCSGRSRRPILRPAQIKGQQMVIPTPGLTHIRKQEYFLVDSTYTVGFKDSTGRVRDYFEMLKEPKMKVQFPLILYMGKH
ncbi:hypothetical protein BJX62DRAFT_144758 [Aspergillus germanicus]